MYKDNLYKILRIIFCVLACACTAVTIFIFAIFGLYGLIPLGGAIVFAVLMFICKNAQEREELKKNPPPPKGDFITGKVKKPDDGEGL